MHEHRRAQLAERALFLANLLVVPSAGAAKADIAMQGTSA